MARHWTEEERKKQSEAIRKWKPWEHSTGAQTNEGKETSKMNAYKHGVRSEGFNAIRKALRIK